MLTIRGLCKSYPGVHALASVDLEVRGGAVHALVGENGAGKSTLVKALGGAVVPDAGTVMLGGQPLPFGDPVRARRAGVAVIYQELSLVGELSVAENIFLGREETRLGLLRRREMGMAARSVLAGLGCTCDPWAPVRSLGLGVQQLVEVGRALVGDARLLVFDEPSTRLTDRELERLFDTIRRLRQQGKAIIYISHRLEEIFALADDVTVLRDGRRIATQPVAQVDRTQLIRWMVGRELSAEFPPRAASPGEVVVDVRGLSCPPFFVDASLTVRAGEVVGLAGLVGAGRSSVGLALFGALPMAAGQVWLAGNAGAGGWEKGFPYQQSAPLNLAPAYFRHPAQALSAGVAYLTEDRKHRGILAELTVMENVTLPILRKLRRYGLIRPRRQKGVAQAACDRFHVRAASLERPIRLLSGGNQQKALLARLTTRPVRLLILDEPTRGIDVGAKIEVYRIINELADQGVGVLMISSELPELLGMCDRIVVMREGRTVGEVAGARFNLAPATIQDAVMQLATGGAVT